MNKAKKPLAWVIGIILFLVAILWLRGNILYGTICLVVSILILPFTQFIIEKIRKKNVPNYFSWIAMLVGVFLLFNSIYLFFNLIQNKADENLKLANKYIDSGNFDTVPHFILKAQMFYSNNNDNKALDLEKEFKNYNDSIYVRNILANMTDEEYELLLDKKLNKQYLKQETLNELLYNNLYEISSNRDLIIKQIEKENLQKKVAKEKEKARQQKIKEQNKRNKLINDQFSSWDGSHRGLTKLIKDNMNDPDSYEHIETRFKDEGDYIFVITKFRGNNAFGGKVINSVSAKVDFNGNVIEIVDQ